VEHEDAARPEPVEGDAAWEMPGTRLSRRARIYATAGRIGARYAALQLPGRATRANQEAAHRASARELYETAVHLRGGFIKFGQFASARPDLLPAAYVEELSKLQDRVPPAPPAVTARVIEEDLGPIPDHFLELDTTWASAASLAQVHRATRLDGTRVAVKVQYPRAAELVPDEARDTRRILRLVSKVVHHVDLPTIADALQRTIIAELDYAQEAANAEEFAANFAHDPRVVTPSVHKDLSHGRVLVLDWVDGENLARALTHVERDVAEEATKILVDSYLQQILVDGFLHADPHPGNFLLQHDDDGVRLGYVDFGACDRISEHTRLALRDLYAAGMAADLQAVAEALDALGFRTRSGDLQALVAWASLFDFNDVGDDREAHFNALVQAARDDPLVKLPDELIMIGRVLIVQTGMVAALRPSWRMDELIAARLAQST
jgi:ubiquinone biosynthesis protein